MRAFVCVCLCVRAHTVALGEGDGPGKRTTKKALVKAGRRREPSFVMLFKNKSVQKTICTNFLE